MEETNSRSSDGDSISTSGNDRVFLPVIRKNSNPWLQKPLHATFSELERKDSNVTGGGNSVTSVGTNNSYNNNGGAGAGAGGTTRTVMPMQYSSNQDNNGIRTVTIPSTANTATRNRSPATLYNSTDPTPHTNNNNTTQYSQIISANEKPHSNPSNSHDVTNDHNTIQRHLTLFDLVSIGVGSTIGSGIFVLCGFIAHNYAGPATCISWTLSGIAACLSGVCYAELACRMPAAGSSYVYVYASMGELPAVLVAACLTLEYLVSASAVARSWGDKVIEWMIMDLGISDNTNGMMGDDTVTKDQDATTANNYYGTNTGDGVISTISTWILAPKPYNFNPLAMLIATLSILLLMNGVKESKSVTNFFTMTKLGLVAFMALLGLILMKPSENLSPFLPPEYGMAGVVRGATSSFFGYIGFDEICCIAGEAIDPQRNIPRAIVLTLACVTSLYILAALALTGMQPFQEISEISGFPEAFESQGVHWAAHLSAFGEVFTLPIVVLISIMAQPRLQYALAKDGLLPPIFARVDSSGNLWHGTVISGIIMILVAAFVPFTNLNDMISAGILVAFSMTDSALVILRHDSPLGQYGTVERLIAFINTAAFVFGVTTTHFADTFVGKVVVTLTSIGMVLATMKIHRTCPLAMYFGGRERASSSSKPILGEGGDGYFSTPCLPFIPCLGIVVNWYLVGQLELSGIGMLLAYLAGTALFYFSYGFHHSIGNNGGWAAEDDNEEYHDANSVDYNDNDSETQSLRIA